MRPERGNYTDIDKLLSFDNFGTFPGVKSSWKNMCLPNLLLLASYPMLTLIATQ